uniref:diguanylate cyclase n=1 Tax=Desulfovibrio sp. U5L TaxID=596152 RepID=I2Q6Q4_9BACT
MHAATRISVILATLLALALVLPPLSWCAPIKNVLVLHNFNHDYPAIAAYDQGLRDVLQASKRYDFRISTEYLNLPSFEKSPDYLPDTARYLLEKYSILRPDAVIVDRAVLPLYTTYLATAFPDARAVLLDEGRPVQAGSLPSHGVSTGRGLSEADIEKNFDLILRLRPGTRQVYIVLGASSQERLIATQMRAVAAKYAGRLSFVITDALSHADLLRTVAAAPADAAILFSRFALDAAGESHIPFRILREVCAIAPVPVFAMVRHFVGDGIVGGYAYALDDFGRYAARRLLESFDPQASAAAAPTEAVHGEYVFDWRALKRWHIAESLLPAGSRVVFRQETLWQAHRALIVAGVALVIAETFLILGLVANRVRRKRAESALVALNASLEARVLDRTRELHESNGQLQAAKEELESLNSRLQRTSRTDSLTGLANRRHAQERLDTLFRLFSRQGTVFSVALLDVDFFKKVNDAHGHETGDTLLRLLARDMLARTRSEDTVARWGGEEFLLLLPRTAGEDAFSLVERLRRGIADTGFPGPGGPLAVTVTIGLATVRPGDVVEDVLRRADAALYRGKAAGRNRVVSG